MRSYDSPIEHIFNIPFKQQSSSPLFSPGLASSFGNLRSESSENSGDLPCPEILADDFSLYFYIEMFVEDIHKRNIALQNIVATLENSLQNDPQKKLISFHLPFVFHYSEESPFEDIRTAFRALLCRINLLGDTSELPMPKYSSRVSRFFPSHSIVPIQTTSEEISVLFHKIFLASLHVPHLDRVLGWHPSVLQKVFETQNYLMRSNSVLPFNIRNYVAILAVARFRSHYYVKQQEREFLLNYGSPAWLQGIDQVPKKIKKLLKVNELLAHQPWLVTPEHIQELVEGNLEERWTIPEVLHVFLIMAHFRALSALAWGVGAIPEFEDFEEAEIEPILEDDRALCNTTLIVEKMLKGTHDSTHQVNPNVHVFESVGQCCSLDEKKADGWGDMAKYIGPYVMEYQSFDSKKHSILHVEQFSWKHQGYEFTKRYYSEQMATLLDEEFNHIYYLTYNMFGQATVDTKHFRRAIWVYIHNIQGFLHDDYDYNLIEEFLPLEFRKFILKVSCRPYLVEYDDIVNMGTELTPSEKTHVTLLASFSRKLVETLYGIVAILKYLKKGDEK